MTKIIVDEDMCIGCGSCESIAPEYFLVDGKSKVKKEYQESDKDLINEAINACPVNAISLE